MIQQRLRLTHGQELPGLSLLATAGHAGSNWDYCRRRSFNRQSGLSLPSLASHCDGVPERRRIVIQKVTVRSPKMEKWMILDTRSNEFQELLQGSRCHA